MKRIRLYITEHRLNCSESQSCSRSGLLRHCCHELELMDTEHALSLPYGIAIAVGGSVDDARIDDLQRERRAMVQFDLNLSFDAIARRQTELYHLPVTRRPVVKRQPARRVIADDKPRLRIHQDVGMQGYSRTYPLLLSGHPEPIDVAGPSALITRLVRGEM